MTFPSVKRGSSSLMRRVLASEPQPLYHSLLSGRRLKASLAQKVVFLCLSDAKCTASAVEPQRLTKADTTPRASLGCFIYFYYSISEVDWMLIALYHHFVDTLSPGDAAPSDASLPLPR